MPSALTIWQPIPWAAALGQVVPHPLLDPVLQVPFAENNKVNANGLVANRNAWRH